MTELERRVYLDGEELISKQAQAASAAPAPSGGSGFWATAKDALDTTKWDPHDENLTRALNDSMPVPEDMAGNRYPQPSYDQIKADAARMHTVYDNSVSAGDSPASTYYQVGGIFLADRTGVTNLFGRARTGQDPVTLQTYTVPQRIGLGVLGGVQVVGTGLIVYGGVRSVLPDGWLAPGGLRTPNESLPTPADYVYTTTDSPVNLTRPTGTFVTSTDISIPENYFPHVQNNVPWSPIRPPGELPSIVTKIQVPPGSILPDPTVPFNPGSPTGWIPPGGQGTITGTWRVVTQPNGRITIVPP
jgi:hypothetical protein